MDLPTTLDCTPAAYWPLILTSVLPPLGAVLSATALWVASRARYTSQDVQSTLAALPTYSPPPLGQPERRESPLDAPGRKKRSTKGTIST